MIAGPSVNEHHFTPKSEGGREKQPIHRICHRKIHSLFTEKELADYYNSPSRLMESDAIRAFVKWLENKPLEFYDNSVTPKSKKR